MRYSVSYATDNNYVQHVAASLVSLFQNNRASFDVYILCNALLDVHVQNIHSIAEKYHQKIYFISVETMINSLLESNVAVNKLSISTYSRLFMSKLIPSDVDKILYLDCDTIIVGDITGIWQQDISNFYVAGVIDTMFPYYKKSIYLPNEKMYINAGVLFVNLKKWRESSIDKEFMSFIDKFDGKVPHLDQGVINGVFHDKAILDLKYNVQTPVFLINKYRNLLTFFSLTNYYSERTFVESRKNPVIIHYSAFFADRPWFRFCLHPKRCLYIKCLKETPYYISKLPINKNSSIITKMKSLFFVFMQPLYFKLK